MKKKIILMLTIIMSVCFITGCDSKKEEKKEETKARQSALDFKKEYEDINGKTAKGDMKYRSLDIKDNNPYVKVTPKEIVEKINNKETFYLYVGDPLCPWCRSGLEKMIEVANAEGIKDIYYIDFWDDDHKEILRDLYEVQTVDGETKAVKTQSATDEYKQILKAVESFAQDYTLTKDGKEYDTGKKRIMGGDHFYFEKGVAKKYVSLRSDKLKNAFDELTEEVLKDQEKKFTEFFTNGEVCTGEDNC